MVNKKIYQNVIEACTGIYSISQIHSKLNKVLISSEDHELKKLLLPVIELLTEAHTTLNNAKNSNIKFALNFALEPYKGLLSYCGSALKSIKPQWQMIAERHGWKPPN